MLNSHKLLFIKRVKVNCFKAGVPSFCADIGDNKDETLNIEKNSVVGILNFQLAFTVIFKQYEGSQENNKNKTISKYSNSGVERPSDFDLAGLGRRRTKKEVVDQNPIKRINIYYN